MKHTEAPAQSALVGALPPTLSHFLLRLSTVLPFLVLMRRRTVPEEGRLTRLSWSLGVGGLVPPLCSHIAAARTWFLAFF